MRALVASLFVLLAAGASPVRADYVVGHADLLCHPTRNIALVRLALAENENPPAYAALPPELDGGLSRSPGTGRRTCRLANGWRVTLRAGVGQAFAHGQGGASPPHFFSLWLNDRKIVSNRIWSGNRYAQELTPVPAVVVTPDTLTVCEGEAPTCAGQPLALATIPIDCLERKRRRFGSDAGSLRITVGARRPLCRSLVRRGDVSPSGAGLDRVGFDHRDGSAPAERVEWIAFRRDPIDALDRPYDPTFARLGGRVLADRIDFFGDGVMRTVLKRSSSGNYFNGSFWVVAPDSVSVQTVLGQLYPERDTDEEEAVERAHRAGWVVFSGDRPDLYANVSLRYVHIDRARIGDGSYLVAHPLKREHDPTAIVFKPAPDGSIALLCRFERVRSNF